jgi:hypothetical protein
LSCREAIKLALGRTQTECVETCWTDAGAASVPEWLQCGDAPYAGGTILDSGYRIVLRASPEEVWKPLQKIGGKTGWYSAGFLWRLRGFIDRMAGGIGLMRGRRHTKEIYAGDSIDFFRVLEVEPPYHLHLLAEMKFPGEATLEFRINPMGDGRTELIQLARYLPRGLMGLIYWYTLYPFHQYVYGGMLKGIARAAGKSILQGPNRFAPGRYNLCQLDPRKQ